MMWRMWGLLLLHCRLLLLMLLLIPHILFSVYVIGKNFSPHYVMYVLPPFLWFPLAGTDFVSLFFGGCAVVVVFQPSVALHEASSFQESEEGQASGLVPPFSPRSLSPQESKEKPTPHHHRSRLRQRSHGLLRQQRLLRAWKTRFSPSMAKMTTRRRRRRHGERRRERGK